MIIVEHILGNINKDQSWKDEASKVKIDYLILDQWEAQKSRCRKETSNGLDIGISLDRNTLLKDGDVIVFDQDHHLLVVVKITLRDVLVIQLNYLKDQDPQQQIRNSFELGHALGNQHWKAVLKEDIIYIPLTVSQKVMSSVLKTHGIPEEMYNFVKGDTVLPNLTNSEARLLFGGAEDTDTHVHVEHSHSHSHNHHH